MDKGDWLWIAYGALAIVMLILILRAPDDKERRERLRDKEW